MNSVFDRIYEHNLWESPESRSGKGSELAASAGVIKGLKDFFNKNNIRRVVDIPCGDFNWMKEVYLHTEKPFHYTGIDVVEKLILVNKERYQNAGRMFIHGDITDPSFDYEGVSETADFVICRDLLIHLSLQQAQYVVERLFACARKGSFVAITHQQYQLKNDDIRPGSYAPRNLYASPFHLMAPLLQIHETLVPGYPPKYLNIYAV